MNRFNTNIDSRWKESGSSGDDEKPMSNPPINLFPDYSNKNQAYRQGNNQNQPSSYHSTNIRPLSNPVNYQNNTNQQNFFHSNNVRTKQNSYNNDNNQYQQYSQNQSFRNEQTFYNQGNNTNQTNSYHNNDTQNQQNFSNRGNNRNHPTFYNYENTANPLNAQNRGTIGNQQNPQNFGINRNFSRSNATENQRNHWPRFSHPNTNFPRNNKNPSEVIFLNQANTTNTSNANIQPSNESYIDKNVKYQPYIGLIFNEMKFSNEINLNNIEIDNKSISVSDRYKNLNSDLKNLLNEEYKTHLSSIEYGSVFPFGSFVFKPLYLKIASMPNYSHEEIRLAYYISRGNPELMEEYEKIMDKYQSDISRILENLNSCDLEKLTTSYEKMYWPKRSERLNVILSRYTEKINNKKKVVDSIIEDAHRKTSKEPQKNINPWYNSPILSLPINHQVELKDPLLEKPKHSDFPTIPNKIPYFYFLNHLIDKPPGPKYLYHNSRSSIFDGAYSYHESVSSEKSYSCKISDRFCIPLQPPSREMCA